MSATLTKAEIARLIPHAGPMCLLERVVRWDQERIVCEATNHRDAMHPLSHDGLLDATAAVEYAAQAMAVHGALLAATEVTAGARPKVGYLASVREVVCQAPYLHTFAGALTIAATRLMGEETRVMYEFVVSAEGEVRVTGRAAVVMDAGVTR
jgi:predicted hotdog family 3-hydroxylacyl-ACP dehydratase